MQNLKWTPSGFVILMSIFALPLLVWAVIRVDGLRGIHWYEIAFLIALLVWAETQQVTITKEYHETPTFSAQLAMMIVVGWPFVVIVSVIASVITDRFLQKMPLIKVAFNTANCVLYLTVSGLILEWGGITGLSFEPNYGFFVVVLASIGYYILNHFCLITVLALVNGRRISDQFDMKLVPMDLFSHGALTAVGFCIALIYRSGFIGSILLTIPIWLSQYAYAAFFRLRMMAQRTVENLATIVDRRDPGTARHSERVSSISEMICDHMALSSTLTDSIVSAARVHDLGKVGIPDAILLKPANLTEEERATIQQHPDMAATIVQDLNLYHDGIGYIRFHHERFDGTGYPGRLEGEMIPFGARVIAVADAYDAMTSDRPYRKALSREEALRQVRAGSGTQFDPLIVEAFLQAMEEVGGECSWDSLELSPSA